MSLRPKSQMIRLSPDAAAPRLGRADARALRRQVEEGMEAPVKSCEGPVLPAETNWKGRRRQMIAALMEARRAAAGKGA